MCFRKERFLREFRPARGGGRRSMISRLVATPRRRRTEAGGLGSESWPGRTGGEVLHHAVRGVHIQYKSRHSVPLRRRRQHHRRWRVALQPSYRSLQSILVAALSSRSVMCVSVCLRVQTTTSKKMALDAHIWLHGGSFSIYII